MSYTPGPWTLTLNRCGWGEWNRIFSADITASDGTVVAVISDINVQEQHLPACSEEDARLMTAAPALLEACRELLDDVEGEGILIVSINAIERIRAAIAKATGGTP